MADEVIFNLLGDASSAIDAIDALTQALSGLESALSAVGSSVAALNGVVDAITGVADSATAAATSVTAVGDQTAAAMDIAAQATVPLSEALGQVPTAADAASASLTGIADAATTALDSTSTAVASLATSFDAIDVSALGLDAIFNDMADAGGASMAGLAANAANLNATLASVGATASGTAASVGTLTVNEAEATAVTDEAGAGMQSAGFMALMLAQAVLQAAGGFLQVGMSAQDALAHVSGLADQSLAGAAGAQRLAQVMATLDQYCMQFGVDATQAANGLYFIMSAGFNTADSMKILKVSMEAAAATGTQMDTVSNALTSIMNAYGVSADKAKTVTNEMVQAVVSGKQNFKDFANSIGSVAQPAHSAGVGINEMLAAESTMTEVQPRVRQDTQNLAALFNYLAENQKKVVTAAKAIDPSFNANAFAAADLEGKLKMLNQAAEHGAKSNADFNANMKTLLGNMTNVKTATMIATDGYKMYEQKLRDINNSQHTLDVAFQQSESTLTAAMNHINAALSVMAKNFVVAISPTIVPILNNIAQAMGTVATHAEILMPIMAALAVLITGVLIVALVALAGMFITMIAPIMAVVGPILLVIAALVAVGVAVMELNNRFHFLQAAFDYFAPAVQAVGNGMRTLWQTFVQSLNAILPLHAIMTLLGAVFHTVAATVMGTLVPALQKAWNSIATELVPAWQKLVAALQPVMQVLGYVAAILGGVLVVAIIAVIAILVGLINAISAAIVGFGQLIAAVIQVATGIVQVFGAMWGLIVGLFTLNGAEIQSSWNMLLDGLKNIAVGIWNAIVAVFSAAFNGIVGLIQGFVGTVVSLFSGLANTLVGHSIIPDMMNAILNVFIQGFARMVSAISNGIAQIVAKAQTLAGQLGAIFSNLAAQAYHWGLDFMQQMANGVAAAAGGVIAAAQNVASQVASLLHFSKPDVGPLADADTWMPDFGDLLTKGLNDQARKVQGAAINVASSVSKATPTSASIAALSTPAVTTSDNATLVILQQILAELQAQTGKMNNGAAGASRGSIGHAMAGTDLGTVSSQFGRGSSASIASTIYAQLDMLAGIASNNGLRGASSGLGIV